MVNHVKINNTTYKLADVKKLLLESIEGVDNGDKRSDYVIKIENQFYEINFINKNLIVLYAVVEPAI